MFLSYEASTAVTTAPGVTRRLLAHSDELMLVEFAFRAGVTLSPHSHPHAQVSYVQSGSVEYQLGDELILMHQGDSITVPPNLVHNCRPLGDAVLLDAFTPPREDFLK